MLEDGYALGRAVLPPGHTHAVDLDPERAPGCALPTARWGQHGRSVRGSLIAQMEAGIAQLITRGGDPPAGRMQRSREPPQREGYHGLLVLDAMGGGHVVAHDLIRQEGGMVQPQRVQHPRAHDVFVRWPAIRSMTCLVSTTAALL